MVNVSATGSVQKRINRMHRFWDAFKKLPPDYQAFLEGAVSTLGYAATKHDMEKNHDNRNFSIPDEKGP